MNTDDKPTDTSEQPAFNWDDHFFGIATVGERGQVVIPAEARKRYQIEPGDKLLIFSPPTKNGVMLCKLSSMRDHINAFQEVLSRVEQQMNATPTRPDSQEENS